MNTLCKSCSSHTTFVGLLYPKGDKSEKVCIGYEVWPTKGLNLFKESECRVSVQIVLCNSFLYTNNIQKYYSVSRCVISIIIVITPTLTNSQLTRSVSFSLRRRNVGHVDTAEEVVFEESRHDLTESLPTRSVSSSPLKRKLAMAATAISFSLRLTDKTAVIVI